MFIMPFSRQLWILLSLLTLALTIAIKFLEVRVKKSAPTKPNNSNISKTSPSAAVDFADWLLTYWAVLMSYFGKALANETWKIKSPLR